MISDKGRKYELDGLKGIACMIVLWYHMILGFFCLSKIHDNTVAEVLTKTILNGDFMVYVFACISGYLAYQVKRLNLGKCIEKCIKRYIRFLILSFITNAFVIFLYKNIGFYNVKFGNDIQNEWLTYYYTGKIDWKGVIIQSVTLDSIYNAPLWALKPLVVGPCILYVISLFESHKSHKTICKIATMILLLVSIIFSENSNIAFIYVACYEGTFLHKYENQIRKIINRNQGLSVISVVILYVAAMIISNDIFHHLLITLSAVLLLAIIMAIEKTRIFLSKKVFIFLGNISLGIYLLHWPLLCSVGFFSFYKLGLNHYITHAAIIFSALTLICLICAYLFHITIETAVGLLIKNCNKHV